MKPEVFLEPLNINHTQDLFDLTDTNRGYLRVWLPWLDQTKSSSDTKSFIESTIKEPSSESATNFAIIYDGTICGVTGFHGINKQHRSSSIGYWLAEDSCGKGIATEAVSKLIKLGFDELKLNKIEIRCAVGNTKSRAIAERLGFTYKTTLRECEWLYKKSVDHVVYSMLASEYN